MENAGTGHGRRAWRYPPRSEHPDAVVFIYTDWCKACGICVAFCPGHVFSRDNDGYPRVTHPEACIGCGWCEIDCPDFAITVREKGSGKKGG